MIVYINPRTIKDDKRLFNSALCSHAVRILKSLFYRWRQLKSEELTDTPNVMWLINVRTRTEIV